MEIKYFGYTAFRIKGSRAVLVTDPFDSTLGIKMPPVTADLVVFSNRRNERKFLGTIKAVKRTKPFVINEPGEYEVSGVFVLGIPAGRTTFYVITMDGIRLVYLGTFNDKLSDKQMEELDGVDVLFLPIGGKLMISPKQAADLVSQIQPKIVIPMAYKLPGLGLDLASLGDFLRQMGTEEIKPIDKILISKDKLPPEREVVILNARGKSSSS